MKYPDGQAIRLGDVVALGSDRHGIVVCSIDSGEYSDAYPQAQWGYLGAGVLIEFPSYGLIHYREPEAGLRLIAHASGLGAGSNRGGAPRPARRSRRGAQRPSSIEVREMEVLEMEVLDIRNVEIDMRNLEMQTGREVDDLAEIARSNARLASTLLARAINNKQRVINEIAVPEPNTVYEFQGGLWWSYRDHPPQGPRQYNNLFGFDNDTRSTVEVNFPLSRFRRSLQGAFVRCTDGSLLLCHRGGVQHRRRRFSVLGAMRDMGATLVQIADNDNPLIRICSIDALQIHEIVAFVSNIIHAKNT